MVIYKDMKAEKVVIVKEEKVPQNQKTEDAKWEPYVPGLPEIVRKQMDKWLSYDEMKHRKKAIRKALEYMIECGQMREKTIVLHLRGSVKGEVIEKEFTFFKSVPDRMLQ